MLMLNRSFFLCRFDLALFKYFAKFCTDFVLLFVENLQIEFWFNYVLNDTEYFQSKISAIYSVQNLVAICPDFSIQV